MNSGFKTAIRQDFHNSSGVVSPLAVFNKRFAGKIGTEEPPGIQAFNLLPLAIPPQYSSL